MTHHGWTEEEAGRQICGSTMGMCCGKNCMAWRSLLSGLKERDKG